MVRNIVLLILSILLSGWLSAQCNGSTANCEKRYNEVAIAMTHNSYNCGKEFRLPNQNLDVLEQLNGGVRGLMLDFHYHKDKVVVMHNYPILGFQEVAVPLEQIRAFLAAHPEEIVTIIIESHVSPKDIEEALRNAELLPYCHVQDQRKDWPILSEMIQTNKRLVVFSERNDALDHQGWNHYAWDYIVDTPYSFHNTNQFKTDVNRGDLSNKLFLLNHWITDRWFGAGRKNKADKTNAYEVLSNRLEEVLNEFGRKPTFLGIDFFEKGAIFQVLSDLNGV